MQLYVRILSPDFTTQTYPDTPPQKTPDRIPKDIPMTKLAERLDDILRRHRIDPHPRAGFDVGREIARLAREALALGSADAVVREAVDHLRDQFATDAADGLGEVFDPRLADLECFIAERANVMHAVLNGRDPRPVLDADITIWLLTTADGDTYLARTRAAIRGDED